MAKGIVVETTGSWHKVKLDSGRVIQTRLKGKIRLEDLKLTNPVAVGDRVILENSEDDGSTVIADVEPRDNKIIRQSPRKKYHNHIIAANIDQAFIVTSLRFPATKLGFINRVLVALEYYDIQPIIIFNKTDLYRKKEMDRLEQLENDLEEIGYPTLRLSMETRAGFDEVQALAKDKLSVFTGHSGVGKTTLINALIPGLELRTREVSEYNEKGMHTTTFATMYDLPNGGYVVDTPGIKEYGVAGIDAWELFFYFPEMNALFEDCKFNNCQHIREPGCAILNALETGELKEWRYRSYEIIREELLVENKNY
ncbi:MAG: ribosome small subunit-dependent GTPase A [Saprospiraceae bacterium]|nr:ribosome small subunit-dependent GTPase A [Saprospiraceae bacterium]